MTVLPRCRPISAVRRIVTLHGLSITDEKVSRVAGQAIAAIIPLRIVNFNASCTPIDTANPRKYSRALPNSCK